MTRVIVDDALRSKLHNLTETIVLCDEAGHIFGHFVPSIDLAEWEPLSAGANEDELERRARSSERRYSTAEVFAHLESISLRENT